MQGELAENLTNKCFEAVREVSLLERLQEERLKENRRHQKRLREIDRSISNLQNTEAEAVIREAQEILLG